MKVNPKDLERLRKLVPGAVESEIERVSEVSENFGSQIVTRPLDLFRDQLRPSLFDYQLELANKMLGIYETRSQALISLPTGAGKTRTAVYGILEILQTNPSARIVWLAPTIELLDQAHDTLVKLWREFGGVLEIHITRKLPASDFVGVWITTPQAINKIFDKNLLGYWNLIIFDEAHQAVANTFKQSILDLRGAGKNKAAFVGLSATPGRMGDEATQALVDLFEDNLLISKKLGAQPVEFLQTRAILANLKFNLLIEFEPEIGNFGRLKVLLDKTRDLVLEGRKCLVFAKSISDAKILTAALKAKGVFAEFVDGELADAERQARLSRFATGETQVIVNQKLLTTGYDCPAVSDVLIQHKISSSIMFEQMVGRAARGPMIGGAHESRIWQFDDHLAIHGLPSSYYRYKDFEWS
jgi:superfamily II DNA or RNA helicase